MIWTQIEHLTFENSNCEVHYWYKRGRGDRYVLFFHGAGLDHRMFEQQIGLFDNTYNLVFWDARGHGLSKLKQGKKFTFKEMLSDCRKLYEILGIEKAVIIGQSMGGNLAQEMAYNFPEAIEKLVLIDCTKNTGKLTASEKFALKLSKPMLACYPWELLIKQSADICSKNDKIKEYVKECLRRTGKATFVEVMLSLMSCLHEDINYKFRHPVLLLCGTEDSSGNIRKIAKPWAESDSSCTLHMIDNAGHNSNQDEPEIVNRYISEFLNLHSNAGLTKP